MTKFSNRWHVRSGRKSLRRGDGQCHCLASVNWPNRYGQVLPGPVYFAADDGYTRLVVRRLIFNIMRPVETARVYDDWS